MLMLLRSSTKLYDKNLRERLEQNERRLRQQLEDTKRSSEERADEQLVLLGQLKHTLGEHTRSLKAQDNTTARLAERMYYGRPNIGNKC